MNIVWVGIVAGVVGTLAMDVLNHLVSRSGAISRIDIELIGRMAAGWVRGRFSYRNPGEMEPVSHEKLLGYLTHYAIGVALALIYVFGWEFLVAGPPSPAWALAYGVATTIASLFFVYPSMGFGVCGLRSPDGMKAPLSSFANHLYFGVGMAVGIALMNALG
jgi:uncharacterized membrane protein YeaQ/YmgE (transglycosylase-associated protein family)